MVLALPFVKFHFIVGGLAVEVVEHDGLLLDALVVGQRVRCAMLLGFGAGSVLDGSASVVVERFALRSCNPCGHPSV